LKALSQVTALLSAECSCWSVLPASAAPVVMPA